MIYIKNFDWAYLLLRYIVLKKFFEGKLEEGAMNFIEKNILKHRLIMWINLFVALTVFLTIKEFGSQNMGILVSSLIAPVMVTGGAWFAISFGGIPKKLLSVGMSVTFLMFLGFSASLTTMFLAVSFVLPPTLWIILVIIYMAVVISCIQYDTADGLKAGLDDVLIKHGRYAIEHYRKSGVIIAEKEED